MQDEDLKQAKRNVREILIEPMDHLGLARPKDLKVVQFEKMLAGFENNLSYMRRDSLHRLRLFIEANLEGPNQNRWPSPAAIYKWARDIQEEPEGNSELVISWLQSVEGPLAVQGGYVVELRNDLKKFKRPIDAVHLRRIKKRAAENRHKFAIVREKDRVGRATFEELEQARCYDRALRACTDIVFAKSPKEKELS